MLENREEKLNEDSMDTITGALCYAMGIEPPKEAHPGNEKLKAYVDRVFSGRKADRILMYNPDAVAEWIYRKYTELVQDAMDHADIEVPLRTVMPSVTPVCFGTMYTGAQPEVHGICKYEKPVIRIDTIFDALIRAGKKPAIVADSECSVGRIFLERNMDYFIYDTIEEINAKAAELILSDTYDFIVVYNGNYDHFMHKTGPEGLRPLTELRSNAEEFSQLSVLVQRFWKDHDTLMGFAMDHGCHEVDGGSGSHGLAQPSDLNVIHLYKGYPREK